MAKTLFDLRRWSLAPRGRPRAQGRARQRVRKPMPAAGSTPRRTQELDSWQRKPQLAARVFCTLWIPATNGWEALERKFPAFVRRREIEGQASLSFTPALSWARWRRLRRIRSLARSRSCGACRPTRLSTISPDCPTRCLKQKRCVIYWIGCLSECLCVPEHAWEPVYWGVRVSRALDRSGLEQDERLDSRPTERPANIFGTG